MNFISTILNCMVQQPAHHLLIEMKGKQKIAITALELQKRILQVQGYLQQLGIKSGDRVVLIGENTIDWVAIDVAIIALGAICVPLYYRQTPAELSAIIRDCDPQLILIDDGMLALGATLLASHSTVKFYSEVFNAAVTKPTTIINQAEANATIIYTSGTSGEPKGVVLTQQNISYMCEQTSALLATRFETIQGEPKLLHYLPLCFAGSRMMLWSSLCIGKPIYLVAQIAQLMDSIHAVQPHYFLNVPAVLERIKRGIENVLSTSIVAPIYNQAKQHLLAEVTAKKTIRDSITIWLCEKIIFKKIKRKISKQIQFLICGSAPLNPETQRWFMMIGIPIYQVYGLTETTGIISIDSLSHTAVKPSYVGFPLPGCEVLKSEQGELWCRGPNIFSHYWNKPEATQQVMVNDWFRTGDLVEFDETGCIRILGRCKELIVLESGHNVSPESIEQILFNLCQSAEHIIVFGHGRPYLSALVTGAVEQHQLDVVLNNYNQQSTHYKKIRHIKKVDAAFSIENGLLTANGKVRRNKIENTYRDIIARIYQ